MHSAIRCACVEWPLGKEACPGTSIGGSSAGQSCDGRGRAYSALKYIATKVPTRLAIASTLRRLRIGPGPRGHHVQEVADEFVRLRQDLAQGVGPLVHRRRDEVPDLLPCTCVSTCVPGRPVAPEALAAPGTQSGQHCARWRVRRRIDACSMRSPRTRSTPATHTIRPTSSDRESSWHR